MSPLPRAATLIGLSLIAGLAGTVAMTLGQQAEIALTDRPPSTVPAKAVEKIVDADAPDPAIEARLSTAAHFAFGTALGLGLAALERLPEPARGGLFFAGAWAAGTSLITGLGLSDPPSRWGAGKLAVDLGHHVVYAAGAAAAFAGLRRLARV